MKHILIDYENIQPKSFDGIEANECHIWLFLGVNQQKSLPLELVETLLKFDNKNVHIIKMQHTGKNALDFYLSFYLGKISEIDSNADVCILAKDSGYDVLVEHINKVYDGIEIIRLPNHSPTLDDITVKVDKLSDGSRNRNQSATTIYQRAIALIKDRPTGTRPSKKSSLINYLKSHLRNEDPKAIDNLVKQMINNKIIVILDTDKLTYKI